MLATVAEALQQQEQQQGWALFVPSPATAMANAAALAQLLCVTAARLDYRATQVHVVHLQALDLVWLLLENEGIQLLVVKQGHAGCEQASVCALLALQTCRQSCQSQRRRRPGAVQSLGASFAPC